MNKIESELEIVIPTYNRAECIEYLLASMKKYFLQNCDFTISIFDSSTNDDTQNLIVEHLSERVYYQRMSPDINVDEKTLIALSQATGKNVYLCGDGQVPQINKLLNTLECMNDSDVSVLYDEKWKVQHNYYKTLTESNFNDKNTFFATHFWQLILYGGSIYKRDILKAMDIPLMVEKFGSTGFIFPSTLAHYSQGSFISFEDDFLLQNPYKQESGWIKNHDAVKIWAKNLCLCADNLGDVLNDEAIAEIIKTTGKRTKFLTLRGLLNFRVTDNFNLKILKTYKIYLKRCNCSMLSAYLVAFTPRFMCIALKKLYLFFKKMLKK